VVWLTGLPGSGKSTLARALERRLFSRGGSPILLDGDTLRAGLNNDLGFSPQDRSETFAVSRRSPPIWHATDTSRSSLRFRPRLPIAPRRAESPILPSAKFMSPRLPRCARAAIPKATMPRPRRHAALVHWDHHDYQPPVECELKVDTSTRSVADATDAIEQMLAETGVLFDELVDLAANI